MSYEVDCRLKAYIQPFERRLAHLELAALAGEEPQPLSDPTDGLTYQVRSASTAQSLAGRLAYWQSVCAEREMLTQQVIREATVNAARNGVPLDEIRLQLPFCSDSIPIPNRRALRYGTHGIHEYRGKFFPQLVRALLNVAQVPEHGLVVDPMCGSGTTAVEAILGGHDAVSADINPLSVLMTHAKCALLQVNPDQLASAYERLRRELLRSPRRSHELTYFRTLSLEDQRYLQRWFSEKVLEDLDLIACAIVGFPKSAIRDLMVLGLSNVLRSVSWQKVDDLRVRKEVRLDLESDPIKDFLAEIGRSVRAVLAFLYQGVPDPVGSASIHELDARSIADRHPELTGRVDAVVTSPPYATALPYLDTDRLSLCYLGLLSRPAHRKRDQEMIGNREITEAARRRHWQRFEAEQASLPKSVSQLVLKLAKLNKSTNVGFRRRNLPALLAKYFLDMRVVLRNIRDLLKPGAPAYVVVGDNHTVAGGERVDIRTAELLRDVSASVGLTPERSIPMEMLASRDIFRRNAVASESILCLRKPRQ